MPFMRNGSRLFLFKLMNKFDSVYGVKSFV